MKENDNKKFNIKSTSEWMEICSKAKTEDEEDKIIDELFEIPYENIESLHNLLNIPSTFRVPSLIKTAALGLVGEFMWEKEAGKFIPIVERFSNYEVEPDEEVRKHAFDWLFDLVPQEDLPKLVEKIEADPSDIVKWRLAWMKVLKINI